MEVTCNESNSFVPSIKEAFLSEFLGLDFKETVFETDLELVLMDYLQESDKGNEMVEYALLGMDNKTFCFYIYVTSSQ